MTTVFRATDTTAEQDALAVRNALVKNGLSAAVFEAGELEDGSDIWEVRVPGEDVTQAQLLIAEVSRHEEGDVDVSTDLDMVTVAEVQGLTGELEAMSIQSILDANGISALIVGASTLPNLSFQVRVAETDLERARIALAEATAAGPAAAAEAARESEASGL